MCSYSRDCEICGYSRVRSSLFILDSDQRSVLVLGYIYYKSRNFPAPASESSKL